MEYSLFNFLKEAALAPTQGSSTSQIPLAIGLHDSARSYGIRAGKGGADEKGLAYSQGVLGAGAGGVLGGAAAGAAVGSPFVASTLAVPSSRDKAIRSAIKDTVTLKTLGSMDVLKSVLDPNNTSISPEVSEILGRRLKSGAGAGAVGFGVGAVGKGLYNMAEYNLGKKLTNPENTSLKTASDMPPFLSQNRSKKVKEIYRALKREHPEYSAGKKARIANAMGKEAEVEYRGKKFPGYNQPTDSDRPEKKKMVLAKKGDQVKLIHFGQKGYKHNYSDAAKKNYLTRSAGIRGKDGSLTANDKFSANYWARRELWPKNEPADGSARSREKRASVRTAAMLVAMPIAFFTAFMAALPKSSRKRLAAEIRDPRLYSNLRGGVTGEDAKERIAAHKHLRKDTTGILSAMHAGFTREKRASDDDFGHKAELAGLGILAAPYAAHLGAKVPGLRKAAKPVSEFLHDSPSVEHAMELGGLGVLATPSLKHFMNKKKEAKNN
jgi:hypothetical protein